MGAAMTIRVLLALLAIVFCFQAEAKDSAMMVGSGQASCGTWTKVQADRQPTDAAEIMRYRTGSDVMTQIEWVRGFISAFNFYQSAKGDVTAGTDMDGIYAWIDNYCANHPLERVDQATIALINELSQRGAKSE
jgi:hypothetical protein